MQKLTAEELQAKYNQVNKKLSEETLALKFSSTNLKNEQISN